MKVPLEAFWNPTKADCAGGATRDFTFWNPVLTASLGSGANQDLKDCSGGSLCDSRTSESAEFRWNDADAKLDAGLLVTMKGLSLSPNETLEVA